MRKRWQRFSEELRPLWVLWKDGHTYGAIGQALAVPLHSVYTVVSRHGGLAPRERARAAHTLHAGEREEISRGLASGDSMRCIARRLGRAPSTVSREIRRHGGVPRYRATEPTKRLGVARVVRSDAGCHSIQHCEAQWPESFDRTGHRSRFPSGCS